MLLALLSFARCGADLCTALYSSGGCSVCVSHFEDHHCAYHHPTRTCISWENASPEARAAMSYGPGCDCVKPSTPMPTPEPPAEAPLPGQCKLYTTCEECSMHYADRNCGWCSEAGNEGCIEFQGNETECNASNFYYHNNAKCGQKIPTPPEPWERYDANATFCYSMTGEWCEKCVAMDPTKHCGWCHTTKECIMGDELGPYFGACPDWSIEVDNKCLGKVSKKAAIGIRVTVGVLITAITIVCVMGCVKSLRRKKTQEPRYDEVQ